MDSSGKFALVTKFSSRQKRKTYEEKLRLYLNRDKLATEPNSHFEDDELIPENLDSVNNITQFINTKMKAAEAA